MPRGSFAECVQPYGTSYFRAQCYVRSAAKVSAPTHLAESMQSFDLKVDDSERQVCVIEATCKTMSEFFRVSTLLLEWAKNEQSVALAALMFDGIYGGDELIYDETIDHIYGVVTPEYGPILAFDSEILATDPWRVILECKRRAGLMPS